MLQCQDLPTLPKSIGTLIQERQLAEDQHGCNQAELPQRSYTTLVGAD